MIPRPFRFLPPLGPPRKSHRQKVLAQWRGVDLSAQEQTRARPAQPVSALMPGVLQNLRMDQRRAEAEIVRVWNGVMDPMVAAHAQPTGLHKGTLFVTVDSSVWLSEIVRYRRREILDRLRHSFGTDLIKRVSYRAG